MRCNEYRQSKKVKPTAQLFFMFGLDDLKGIFQLKWFYDCFLPHQKKPQKTKPNPKPNNQTSKEAKRKIKSTFSK